MSAIIDAASVAVALVSVLAAACIDLRSSRIPNWLTFATIAVGAALLAWRCLSGYPLIDALIVCIVSYALAYGFWRIGLWGGGDAKAVLGLSLLASPVFYPLIFLAIYMACLSLALFARHYVGGALSALAGLDLKTAGLALMPLPLAVIAFILAPGPLPAMAAGFIVFALAADLVSGSLPYSEKIEASDAAGRMLMENIYVAEGSVVRIKKRPGLIIGLLDRLNSPLGRPLIGRSPGGLSCEDVMLLKKYVKDVEVAIQRPMGPSLAAAFIMAVLAGLQLPQGGIP